jgi:phosphoribosyl-ATP pyrophosphohydrolase
MDAAALELTRSSGLVTFHSRSKGRLWTKGESSGNVLRLKSLHADCDADALLVLAEPVGPTCHRGTRSCFGEARPPLGFLAELDALVAQRAAERPAGSYTTQLFEGGMRRIAQKVGEEGVETALAAVTQGDGELIAEAQQLGAGEIVLNCMGRDGVRAGYDEAQLAQARAVCTVPLVASGGAGTQEHFREVFGQADVDGALAASVFHSGAIELGALKRWLAEQGVAVRS